MKPLHIVLLAGGALVVLCVLARSRHAPVISGGTAKAEAPPATPIVTPSNPMAGVTLAFHDPPWGTVMSLSQAKARVFR